MCKCLRGDGGGRQWEAGFPEVVGQQKRKKVCFFWSEGMGVYGCMAVNVLNFCILCK